jgi:hypothetical protein
MKRLLASWILLAMSTPVAAQWLALSTPGIPRTADGKPDLTAPAPRTAEGHPDLSGLWIRRGPLTGNFNDLGHAQEWARTLKEERERSYFTDEPAQQCLPSGPAYVIGGDMRRIIQGAAAIAVLNYDLTYRQIFLDGRSLEPNPNPIWMGYSVGHWEGDTLVVESNGFNDKTWLNREGLSHTEQLRVTERYRRIDLGRMSVDITYTDPDTFEIPLNATIELRLVVDDEMLETVCNEASEGTSHYVGAIADAETSVIEVDPTILAGYVGTYRGYWGQTLVTVEVSLEDGALVLRRFGRSEPYRMLAQSDNTFQCSCGLGYIFARNSDGPAPTVDEVHVTGGWTFARIP